MAKSTLKEQLEALIELMGGSIAAVQKSARAAQKKVSQALAEALLRFEIKEGALVRGQDLKSRIAAAEKSIYEALGEAGYTATVSDYFGTFTTVEERNIAMHRTFNEIEVSASKLTPARRFVLQQAQHFLSGAGLAEAYVQPAKFLMMQQVVTGMTLADAQELLKKWADGQLMSGAQTNGRKTPNLEQYATQITRDSLYQYHGTINDLVRKEYRLEAFIYVGDIIADSRPLCRHLVQRGGEVPFSEIDALIAKYPQGTIPGTDKSNFLAYRGGYSCRHSAFPVRKSFFENTN